MIYPPSWLSNYHSYNHDFQICISCPDISTDLQPHMYYYLLSTYMFPNYFKFNGSKLPVFPSKSVLDFSDKSTSKLFTKADTSTLPWKQSSNSAKSSCYVLLECIYLYSQCCCSSLGYNLSIIWFVTTAFYLVSFLSTCSFIVSSLHCSRVIFWKYEAHHSMLVSSYHCDKLPQI